MPYYSGTDGEITLTGLASGVSVNVHKWRLRIAQPRHNWTGQADKNPVFQLGDRLVDLVLECSLTGTTVPRPGDTFTAAFDIDGDASDDETENFTITDVDYESDKQSMGGPQRVRIVASANVVGAGNTTATDGLFDSID